MVQVSSSGTMAAMTPTLAEIRRVPKVLLHDHLDGGLRPATIVELAAETGYRGLPTTDAGELAAWFDQGAKRGAPRAVPRDVRTHRRRHADQGRPRCGWPPSAPRTWPPTASSTPRSASRPSCT